MKQTTEAKYKKTVSTSFNKLFQAFERLEEHGVYDIARKNEMGIVGTYSSEENRLTGLNLSKVSPEGLADLADMLKALYNNDN